MSDQLDLGELREAIRGVLSDRSQGLSEVPGEEGRGLDQALWSEMAALGWTGLPVPEAYGGLGLGLDHLGVLYEELGRELGSVPILPTMMAAVILADSAADALKARWLPAIAAGERRAAIGLPGAVSDLPVLDENGRLSGETDNLLFGDVADLYLVPAQQDGDVVLVAIEAGTPGVSVAARPLVDLTRSIGRLTLDGVAVEAASVLRLGQAQWDAVLDHAAMGIAADAVGGAARLLERTVEYLQIREQFGRPIGSFQALKHRAADWKVKIEAATVHVRHVGALLADGADGASAAASAAKAYACDIYAAFAGDAVQLHGGIGFTWEHPCHLYLKRAKLSQQLFGSSTSHKDRTAALVFNRAD